MEYVSYAGHDLLGLTSPPTYPERLMDELGTFEVTGASMNEQHGSGALE